MDNSPLNQYGLIQSPPVSPETPIGIGNSYAPGAVNATFTGGVVTGRLSVLSNGNADRGIYLDGTNSLATSQGIYAGNAVFSSAPFSVDLAGNLKATSATISGSITATTGTIGGFSITSNTITATNLTFTSGGSNVANVLVGTGSTAAGLNSAASGTDIAIWAGSNYAGITGAPFRVTAGGAVSASNMTITGGSLTIGANFSVTSSGVLTASSATISGSITATSGQIGGFTIGSTTVSATNLILTSGAANTANIQVGTGSNLAGMNSANSGTDITFWAGDTFANRATAPFNVQANGNLTVSGSGSTITGATLQTASSGQRVIIGTSTLGGFSGNSIIFTNPSNTAVSTIFANSTISTFQNNSGDASFPDTFYLKNGGLGANMFGYSTVKIGAGGSTILGGTGGTVTVTAQDNSLPANQTVITMTKSQMTLEADSSTSQVNNIQITPTQMSFFNVTPVNRQTGGALTAGGAYGATEQTMLNNVFKGMQNLGLLN